MRPLATSISAGSQWLFGDNLNKKIAHISSMSNGLSQTFKPNNQQGRYNHSTASITSKVKKLPTSPEELCPSEKGSETEQQLILQELNLSTDTLYTFCCL